ncbi:DUF397 domain-containing protein [Streptomyces sp. NBC_01478]|uniref:DUF397 domain-containing protein n=1 Tax=Streptomyces sp. NBC_01478 TaxID=2903882 RepID=UPI002E35CA9B|nr:DUF397 domain-containing protein [Streptomyces sp. NBC_01478]
MNSAGAGTHNRPVWFTSSYSNGAGGECVECALTDEYALVRDTKDATGPVVTVQSGAWCSFVQALRHSESTN